MELIWAVEEDSRRILTKERHFRDRSNVLETLDDACLIRDFRFPRHVILELIGMCDNLKRKSQHTKCLPVHVQVLATLR